MIIQFVHSLFVFHLSLGRNTFKNFTEDELFTADGTLFLASEGDEFQILLTELKDNSCSSSKEIISSRDVFSDDSAIEKDIKTIQEIFENSDALLFAVHILNLKGEGEVKRSGVRYTLKDVLPVGQDKDKHSFLKVSLMLHKTDKRCTDGDKFRLKYPDLMYEEVIDIEEVIQFQILRDPNSLNMFLKVRESHKVHLLVIYFLLRFISVIYQNLKFFTLSDEGYLNSLTIVTNSPESEDLLKTEVNESITDLLQEKRRNEILPEWIKDSYKYELTLLGMLPCSFSHLLKLRESETLDTEIKSQIHIELLQKNISSSFYRLQGNA